MVGGQEELLKEGGRGGGSESELPTMPRCFGGFNAYRGQPRLTMMSNPSDCQGSFYENTVQKSVCSVLSVVCIVYSEQVGHCTHC